MFTIRLSIAGQFVDVIVKYATSLFSAMNQAEREHGGKAIGGRKISEAGQINAGLAMVFVVIAFIIAAIAMLGPTLGSALHLTAGVGDCLNNVANGAAQLCNQ